MKLFFGLIASFLAILTILPLIGISVHAFGVFFLGAALGVLLMSKV